MNEELENVKLSLQNINDMVDIKNNLIVSSVLMAPVKAIPIIGDLIDSTADKLLDDFQQKKEQELIDVILTNSTAITTEMVNNVEFIINYARVVEVVRRLATNDKVKFFGNLIRNGYLSGEHIEYSEFEEYIDILNTMSYREIKYLVDYKKYCEEKEKNSQYKSKVTEGKVTRYNRWSYFTKDYPKTHNVTAGELYYTFVRMKQTGFWEEEFETDSGDVDKDDYSFSSLSIDSTGFYITKRFLKFYDMVLMVEE